MVIFLQFHILMTYSDCAFLKPFCKCIWFTDVHLRNQAFSLRVWLALFAEFTESLYLNSPGFSNGNMRCWKTFKHWKLKAHCKEGVFLIKSVYLGLVFCKICKGPWNEMNLPEKQNHLTYILRNIYLEFKFCMFHWQILHLFCLKSLADLCSLDWS